jgi:hypothetical protein
MSKISELIDRWNQDEGKPYKGSLIDYATYKPGELSCMCAQGQVLHVVAGWSVDDLRRTSQGKADLATAKALNISRAHAVLLRIINDSANGAPSIVLTDPGKVLGDQWSKLLDFWHYMDGLDRDGWQKVVAARVAARVAAGVAARVAAGDAAGDAARDAAGDAGAAAGDAAWAAAGDAAGAAARAGDAAWAAAWEIQGAAVLASKGRALFFLPMFGFASPNAIPARPADYGVVA